MGYFEGDLCFPKIVIFRGSLLMGEGGFTFRGSISFMDLLLLGLLISGFFTFIALLHFFGGGRGVVTFWRSFRSFRTAE